LLPPTAHTSDAELPQTPERISVVPLETLDQGRVVMMENVTAVRPVTVAVAVFVPTVVPVMNFAAAFPLASVITVAGVTLPPPAVTAKATLTPDLGLLEASVTCTRMESEKLVPATTVAGSVPSLVTLAALVVLVPVESPHAVRTNGVSTADIRRTSTRVFISPPKEGEGAIGRKFPCFRVN
jgi:hypothetical protein